MKELDPSQTVFIDAKALKKKLKEDLQKAPQCVYGPRNLDFCLFGASNRSNLHMNAEERYDVLKMYHSEGICPEALR